MPDTSGGESPYDNSSWALISLVDEMYEPDISMMSSESLAHILQKNKLSSEYFRETPFDSPEIEPDNTHRERRVERMSSVCSRLNQANISYASMKNLRTPMAMMSDIDLLVPDPSEQARACRVLADDGFDFYRFRLLAHPRKLMAKQSDTDPRPVDIYPDAMWIRKVVCDAELVIKRASKAGERTPAPADDLYLVATHAYSHLSVTFAELYHGVLLLEDTDDFDWSIVIENATSYGCLDAVYAYLLLLDEYLAATGRKSVPDHVFKSIPDTLAVRLARRWWEQSGSRSFPVELPIWLPTIVSSFHHVPRAASKLTLNETWKDLQSHYLTIASRILLGEV